MRWLWTCGCGRSRHSRSKTRPCIIPSQLGSHVHASKHSRTPRRLLVTGGPGTGKTYLVGAIITRSRFNRVYWLRLGTDMDSFVRLIGAVLAEFDIFAHEDEAILALLSRCDDPDTAIVVDDFRGEAPHAHVVLDLLQEMRAAIIVSGELDIGVAARFDSVLVCEPIEGQSYDQLQLARGLSPNLDWASPPQRRLAQAMAVLDDVVPESLLLCMEDTCETGALDLLKAGVLQFTSHCHLEERGAILSGSVRRDLRQRIERDALIDAANAIRLCWVRKTSSRRWALSLTTHGEVLAEFFTESLLVPDAADSVMGAFCDHLTVLGSLYIYALRPRHALCSFKTSLSLISSLPHKQTSHYLCMMRTLHCMANVYGSIGDTEGQNRTLAAAFAIDSQLRRSDLSTRPSQRKTSRHRLRHKLQVLSTSASQIVDLGDGSRRHSFTPSHDEQPRKVRKRSLPPPAPAS